MPNSSAPVEFPRPALPRERHTGLVMDLGDLDMGSRAVPEPLCDTCSAAVQPGAEGHLYYGNYANYAIGEVLGGWVVALAQHLPISAPAAMHQEAAELATVIRSARTINDLAYRLVELRPTFERLQEFYIGQTEMVEALYKVLYTIVDKLGKISAGGGLEYQVDAARKILAGALDARQVERVDQRLREVGGVQISLQDRIVAARKLQDQRLVGAQDEMARVSAATMTYQDLLDTHVKTVSDASSLPDIQKSLKAILRDTVAVRQTVHDSREQMDVMREQVRTAEAEISRLQAELIRVTEQACSDALTGVLNRKGLDDAFAREHGRQKRRGTSMCLALLDIDNFKRINDQLGHSAGDEALTYLARVLKAQLRTQDTLGRYGGEEFVILLPETSIAGAEIVLARIQKALAAEIFKYGATERAITLSAGVTPVGPRDTQAVVVKRADAAMYRAKQAGKNRVEIDYSYN